jgi:hypothetical protein
MKIKKTFYAFISVLVFLSPLADSSVALARPKTKSRVDNAETLLDLLEQRLLQKEESSLSFGPRESEPAAKDAISLDKYDRPIQRVQGSSTEIEGAAPGDERLRDISRAIGELDREVEQLSADVVRIKGEIIEDTKLDNYTEITVKLENKERVDLRNLEVHLDKYPIGKIDRSIGVWMPSSEITLFSGPIQPGNHKIEVETRVALKGATGLPLEDNIYYTMKQNFDVAIGVGKARNKLTILIKTPQKNLDNEKIVLDKATGS